VYSDLPKRKNPKLAPALQPSAKTNHFFGRILPKDNDYASWCDLTQIGKLAWLWNHYNLHVLEKLSMLPDSQYMVVKLEDIDYENYKIIHRFAGGRNPLGQSKFNKIKNIRPGKGKKHKTIRSWSNKEKEEFLSHTQESRDRFNYQIGL
jgi:hypothetical protein